MTGLHVNEMNVDPVDLGHEHWQRVESSLHLAPVVIGPPVADDFLEFPKLIALRAICDGLLIGPPRFGNAPAEIDKCSFGNLNLERTNSGVAKSRRKNCLSGKDGDTECRCEGDEHAAAR